MATKEDTFIVVTPAMVAAAVAEANELIRAGKWPEPYDGDDQLVFDDDDLPPAPHGTLKAAE